MQAFLQALAPAELDLYARALAALREEEEQVAQARGQQLERLRYQARLAERQFNQADPDNRLVAAALERRWETALRDLKDDEDTFRRDQQASPFPAAIDPALRQAFEEAGRNIPHMWRQDLLAAPQKKAFLRCLIDKVVVHRSAPDSIRTRIVWKGGDTTTADVPVTVGALARLSSGKQLEQRILELARQGEADEVIAAHLTQQGHRSPKHTAVLPSTVRIIRLRYRVLVSRRQAHPRCIPGFLTVPQLARRLQLTVHWIYDRIHNGTIAVALDPERKLYLFPDQPRTVTLFRQLRTGKLQQLCF